MLTIKSAETIRYATELQHFAKKSVPYALRDTLNDLAFTANRQWKTEMDEQFVLRNNYVVNSRRVVKAKGKRLDAMESRVGSVFDGMFIQEFGGVQHAGEKHGHRVPTSAAAGQYGASPRTKRVRPGARINRLNFTNPKASRFSSAAQRIAVALRLAAARGEKYTFIENDNTAGIYRIKGGKRKPRLVMLQRLMEGSVFVPPHPTLAPATWKAAKQVDKIALKHIMRQLKSAAFHKSLWK